MLAHPFSGRRIVIATKHHKEVVIAPVVKKHLQVLPLVPVGLDTDQLGTFSGEKERTDDPLTTAIKKCDLAMALTGCTLAIANEGSFGPHPHYSFLPCDEELMVLVDREKNLLIKERLLSTDTNFAGQFCNSWHEAESFAQQAGFPEHGLIVKNEEKNFEFLAKGITTWSDLKTNSERALKIYGRAFLETDMRASFNPTRMKRIGEVADALMQKVKSLCPECQTPGFEIKKRVPGLTCSLCGGPTKTTKDVVFSCDACAYSEIRPIGDKTFEDPQHCDFCNP